MSQTTEYLGCSAGNTLIGIPVSFVQEVFQSNVITRVPGCPEIIAGMVNVRGTIVPILDLWKHRGKKQPAKIVILATTQGSVGLLVGDIVDLVRFPITTPVKSLPPQLQKFAVYFSESGTAESEFYLMQVDELIASTVQPRTDPGTAL
jgi:chemotaxis signal transduction protein